VRHRNPAQLLTAARSGDRGATARLLSMVEQGGEAARDVGRLVYPLGGNAYTVGLTGAPGAGKSTLTSQLISVLRASDSEVAVLAVDPSSPFSGGAILGDRVRMQDHATDAGVFIRSMATRGHLGGLALAAPEAIRLLDAVGKPWILVETVGVGQVEVEIAGEADTTVVVVNPGWGDAVQANKAGLLEIGDVFVINKADRTGVAETRRDLEQMLDLSVVSDWRPPIVPTVAPRNEGISDLWDAVLAHRAHLVETGQLEKRRERRLARELEEIVIRRLEERARSLLRGTTYDELYVDVLARRTDPWSASERLLDALD
jgi:LAO/AO transport system kinase